MPRKPSRIFWAWLAGFIDGEGCIHSHKDSLGLRLIITNTHRDTLIYIQQTIGGKLNQTRKFNPPHSAAWKVRWSGEEARKVLIEIQPYSILKAEHVRLGLSWKIGRSGSVHTEKQLNDRRYIHNELARLNKRGEQR
jgi:hypothetical protein